MYSIDTAEVVSHTNLRYFLKYIKVPLRIIKSLNTCSFIIQYVADKITGDR